MSFSIISSKLPLASPASTMATYNLSNVLGNKERASEREEPVSTVMCGTIKIEELEEEKEVLREIERQRRELLGKIEKLTDGLSSTFPVH